MRYRVTVVTPTLVGDGQYLSPIDYMVWKDQVNVLDQRRIFKLLARGPRLDGYLAQIKRAEKLDFASWGGFAQNYAGRRIALESPSLSPLFERLRADNLHIPTFTAGPNGAYLPASALKGALRTAMVYDSWQRYGEEKVVSAVIGKFQGDRLPRRPAELLEDPVRNRARNFLAADSAVIPPSVFKVYQIRTSNLRGQGENLTLDWKDSALPMFAEMASPGTVFEGVWQQRKPGGDFLRDANNWSAALLDVQLNYARRARLDALAAGIEALQARLADFRERRAGAMLSLGWGAGFTGKTALLNTSDDGYRKILRALPYYSRAVQTGLPFPKTRRVVMQGGQPAALPGWVELIIEP